MKERPTKERVRIGRNKEWKERKRLNGRTAGRKERELE